MTSTVHPAQAQNASNATVKDIIICKNSALESKIFAGILKGEYPNIDIALNFDELVSKILNEKYKLMLVDRKVAGFDTDKLSSAIRKHNTGGFDISSVIFDDSNNTSSLNVFNEVVKYSITKADLEKIAKKYVK